MSSKQIRISGSNLTKLELIDTDINVAIGGLLIMIEKLDVILKTGGVKNPGPLPVEFPSNEFKGTTTSTFHQSKREEPLEEDEREFLRSYVLNGESTVILEGAVKQFGKDRVDELLKRV